METQSRSYLLDLLILFLVPLGPFAVGAIGFTPVTVSLLFVFLAFVAWEFRPNSKPSATKKIIVPILSVCLTVTGFDLVARPVLRETLLFRPTGMFESPWPLMPLVSRYAPYVHYRGHVYGDLVGLTGERADREVRDEEFLTDAYGFRNEVAIPAQSAFLDVILLGDSMADGANTTQEGTLTNVLSKNYGQHAYNLSMTGAGPWEEYVNLLFEIDRLRIKPAGTVLLWAIFTGNDLDDRCYALLEKGQLPQNGWLRSRLVSYDTFRRRSPVRLLRIYSGLALFQHTSPSQPQIIKRVFLNGRKMLFLSSFALRRNRSSVDILRTPNFSCIKSTMDAMKKLGEERHIEINVVVVPSKEEVYSWVLDNGSPWSADPEPSGFATILKNVSAQEGFRFLDLKPFLIDASKRAWEDSRESLWWYDDIHWNVRGQKEAAAVIDRELLQHTPISHANISISVTAALPTRVSTNASLASRRQPARFPPDFRAGEIR